LGDVVQEKLPVVGVVEYSAGVEAEKEGFAVIGGPGSAFAHDGHRASKEPRGSDASQGRDGPGLQGVDLSVKEGSAGFDFIGEGIPVLGRATLQHICDENLAAPHPRSPQGLSEQLPGWAHKRFPLLVLPSPGRLSDQEQGCAGMAYTRHSLDPGLAERASLAASDLLRNGFQNGCGIVRCGWREGRTVGRWHGGIWFLQNTK
jgi:hypothetical protein